MIKKLLFALLLTPLAALAAKVPGPVVPGPLVDDAWLEANRAQVVVLDVGNNPKSFVAQPTFETDKKTGRKMLVDVAGRIPGARLVNNKEVRTDRMINGLKISHVIPEKAAFEKLVQKWGVNQDSAIVIVAQGSDTGDLNNAARLYWQFKYYGEDNVAILDGGHIAWLEAGRAFESGPAAAPATGNWQAKGERKEIFASSEEVADALAQGQQVVDGRPLSMYYGVSKSGAVKVGGHLSGAKVFTPDLVTQPKGAGVKYLSQGQYRQLLAAQGINPDAESVTYCNTGHLASGVWFVMSELVGNKKVKLYDGSMHQWTAESKPVKELCNKC
jgi:thiosulfate/3-mercaptopyruvate sulfurtransferase